MYTGVPVFVCVYSICARFDKECMCILCVCVRMGTCSRSRVESLTLWLCIKARQTIELREHVSSLKLSSLTMSNGLRRSII